MKCPNCGAEIKDGYTCSYCGYEDKRGAEEAHERKISNIYEKIAKLLNTPVEKAEKIVKLLGKAGIVLAAVVVIAFAGAAVFAKVNPDYRYNKQQEKIERLEELYASGQYDEMTGILADYDDGYKTVYDKYRKIGSINNYINMAEEFLPDSIEFAKQPHTDASGSFRYDIEFLCRAIEGCRELRNNGYVYSEKEVAEALENTAIEMLKNDLMFSAEEIEAFLAVKKDEDKYMELSAISADRIREAAGK